MLLTNTTQTVDVDIWDYWHFAFTGALAAIVPIHNDTLWLGIVAAVVNMVIIMVLGDVTAPEVEKSLDLRAFRCPIWFTTIQPAPIAMVINKLIDTDSRRERYQY